MSQDACRSCEASLPRAERGWWPLPRLLTVGLVFGLAAHYWRFGWNTASRELWACPEGLSQSSRSSSFCLRPWPISAS